MHDNPDPDAIASGWAIGTIIEEKLGLGVRLVAGGAIVRAENRHMVDLLAPPVQLVINIDIPDNAAAVLVDCGLDADNQLLTRDGIEPVAVIDHHLTDQAPREIPFVDVRPDVAASATIAASYLREQSIEPGPKLATALTYAMRTETRGCEFRYSVLDHEMLVWLTRRAEPELLAEIESAPLEREYYADLAAALRATEIYHRTGYCLLPRAAGPEIVGEIADLLIRCKEVECVLCAALCDDDVVISARTEFQGMNAARLLRKTLAELGHCGGHRHRAGGKIAKVKQEPQIVADLCNELRRRWLAACGIESDERSAPLLIDDTCPPE